MKSILFGILVTAMLLGFGITNANAESETYSKNYIQRMFIELEPVMVYDENRFLTLNYTEVEYYGFSPYDVEFGEEYIKVHNNLITAMSSGGNVTEALLPITNGKFSGLFEESKRVKRGYFDSTVCGGSFTNPHPPLYKYVDTTTTTEKELQNLADSTGYHSVMIPFSGYAWLGSDYSKKQTSNSPSGCNNGEFREQFEIKPNVFTSYKYAWDEPNPETFSYWSPAYWWNSYTVWWHLK